MNYRPGRDAIRFRMLEWDVGKTLVSPSDTWKPLNSLYMTRKDYGGLYGFGSDGSVNEELGEVEVSYIFLGRLTPLAGTAWQEYVLREFYTDR